MGDMTRDEEIASLEARLRASRGMAGYDARVKAIERRLEELREPTPDNPS